MNKRALEIILLLIKSNSELTIEELSNQYKVSERTIYNDLNEIENILVNNNLEVERKGGRLNLDTSKMDEQELKKIIGMIKDRVADIRQFDPDTRIDFIVFLILKSEMVTTKYLAKELDLSVSTIKNDLNVIKKKILSFNLELVTERFVGVSIIGKEVDKRDLLIEIILENYKINKIEDIDIFYTANFDEKLLNDAQCLIDNVAKVLEIQYVDKHYTFVLISTYISLQRIIKGKYISKSSFEQTDVEEYNRVFKVIKNYMRTIFKSYEGIQLLLENMDFEVDYIVSKIQVASYHGTLNTIYDNWLVLQFIVNRLVKNIENQSTMIDGRDNKLHQELIQHLRPAVKRLENNISFENPLKDEIYNKYSELFKIVKENIDIIEHFFDIEFTDDELSYIVLLFASSYERNKKTINVRPSVIIVCKEGISTSSILKSQLEQQFDINILKTYSKNNFLELYKNDNELNFDFVISTVPLDLEEHLYLKVNPILNEKDIMQLNTMFRLYNPEKSIMQIIDQIDPYVIIKDEENLKRVLSEILGISNEVYTNNPGGVLMLKDVINEDLVATNKKVANAYEAVEIAGGLLKNNDLINDNYISAMKNNLKENGPYFVIAPGIAMPHARPEEGAKGVGISMITLESPVEFGHPTNDPVRLVIGLCAIDHQTHLNALAELMDILSDEQKREKIMNANNKIELLKVLRGE